MESTNQTGETTEPAKPKRPSNSLADKMQRVRLMITNGSDSEVLPITEKYKLTAATVASGKQLCDSAFALTLRYDQEFGESIGATAEADTAKEHADSLVAELVKLARVTLMHDPVAVSTLELVGKRKRKGPVWAENSLKFCSNLLANPGWITAMGMYGVTEPKVREALAATEKAIAAISRQAVEESEAHTARIARDEALDNLFEWASTYKTVARIALAPYPKLIEKLGL